MFPLKQKIRVKLRSHQRDEGKSVKEKVFQHLLPWTRHVRDTYPLSLVNTELMRTGGGQATTVGMTEWLLSGVNILKINEMHYGYFDQSSLPAVGGEKSHIRRIVRDPETSSE